MNARNEEQDATDIPDVILGRLRFRSLQKLTHLPADKSLSGDNNGEYGH